jgi:hypothetical protein
VREFVFFLGNAASLVGVFKYLIPGLEWAGIAACICSLMSNAGDLWQGVYEAHKARMELSQLRSERTSLQNEIAKSASEKKEALQAKLAENDKKIKALEDKFRSSCARAGKAVWAMLAALVGISFLVAKLVFQVSTGIAPIVVSAITCFALAIFVGTLLWPKLRDAFSGSIGSALADGRNELVEKVLEKIKNSEDSDNNLQLLFSKEEIQEFRLLINIKADEELRRRIRKSFGIPVDAGAKKEAPKTNDSEAASTDAPLLV